MGEISRRGFLSAAAVGAATVMGAGALSACSPASATDGKTSEASGSVSSGNQVSTWRQAPDPITDIAETYECDVLVIGLGHAGCAAFRAAAEAGAKVCALHEAKEDALTFRGGGQIGHINSAFLEGRGVPNVDVVEFMNDWQVRSNNRSNPGLVMNYAKNCGPCFDWLFPNLTDEQKESIEIRSFIEGAPFKKELSGVKTWVGTAMMGDYINDALMNCIEAGIDAGGKVYYGTKACQLVTDDQGAVTGAVGEGPDGYVRVNAAKGVIVTTGGFGANADMCADLLYEINERMGPDDEITAMMDSDGTGIQMGYWAGGRIDPCIGTMDGAYWYPTDQPVDLLGATAALWINADGKRYSNEGFGSTELQAMPGAWQPSGEIATVFDSNVEELIKAQPFGHMAIDYSSGDFSAIHAVMEKAYAGKEKGSADDADAKKDGAGGDAKTADDIVGAMSASTVFAADDFKTLGTYLGYTGAALDSFVETIEHYNELCAAGADTDFGKDPSLMIGLTQPPYYGYKGTKKVGVIMVTCGGLLVDAEGRVLDENYHPVSGLYAAGNASGGRFGWQYFTSIAGQSLSMAETMGMLTGRAAAQQ
ncbi:FAD-binding protein [Eggerthella sinensis]|uniref:FAD-dependent oxidoreductase 2 FAD-binding domain-containing protein n=1 Tax=Eggerthella sinensis TaxID=242230 RepID=A0A3N0IXX4_9ACTN|nr:FAD-binding protein [Eggerthella sinensis]RDB67969.1 hypothetical protein C1876_11125 [Eggerthella sinensis]RNM41811.1 hypothetical protein DMP09_07975 [Eggerthella sinensis]